MIPSNLEESFEILKKELTPAEQIEILNMPEDVLWKLHSTLGLYVRNNWGLWAAQSSLIKAYFNNLGIYHADDMSGIIIKSFWHHLRKEPVDLENQIDYYKDFWKTQGNK